MQNKDSTSAACMFLLFLLLTPVTPKCRKGTAEECKKAKFVPGYLLAGNGFDILDLTVNEELCLDVYQWKTPDGGCTLCENPLMKGKPLQRLPLIITDWKANLSCQQEVQHSVHQSAISVAEALTALHVKNDWRKELDVKISPGDKVQWALSGSRSKMTQDCIRKSSEDKYIFLLHHITCSYYKFRVSKDQLLSAHFQHNVNRLPEKYDASSRMEYLAFIKTYGSHFGTELDLGVHVRYLTVVPECKAVLEGFNVSEVSRCLAIDIGIAFDLDGVTNNPDFQMCKEKKKNPNFFLLLSEMNKEIVSDNTLKTPKEWLESSKFWPDLLSSSLEPLHTLVDKADPQREGLRQAVSEYVRESVLWRNCCQTCSLGLQSSVSGFCSCECPNNNFTNPIYCSKNRGLTKLTITIERAENLWGDIITSSDSYIKVLFQKKWMRTHTVWSNNNPTWNVTFDFGIIQLHKEFNELQLHVMDEDFGWDDDLLGKCKVILVSGRYESQSCYLDLGRLYFKYSLVCGRNLAGPSCSNYSSVFLNDYYEEEQEYYYDY